MHWSFLLLVAATSASVISRSLHEKRTEGSHLTWVDVGPVHPERVLPMRFGLKQSNLHRLDEELMAVADPESPRYGQHWSPERVKEFFAPSKEAIEAVSEWLHRELGAERVNLSLNEAWVEVHATAAEAERLLDTKYRIFKHAKHGTKHIGCHSYSVPTHLSDHIDIVTPTVHFSIPHRRNRNMKRADGDEADNSTTTPRLGGPGGGNVPKNKPYQAPINKFAPQAQSTTPTGCDSAITPACLKALYNITHKMHATRKNSFAIVEYTPQAYLQSDLDMFFKTFSPNQKVTKPVLVSIDGGTAQTDNQGFQYNGESDLDLEFAMALVDPQKIILYQAGDVPEGASFGDLLDALDASYCYGDDPNQDSTYPDTRPGGYIGPKSCGITQPANVISTSYGYNEADLPAAYEIRQCNEYGKLGMMGTTVIFSSGDNGVAGNSAACLTGTNNVQRFNPGFPATCPYVTSVGATQINKGAQLSDPESACQQTIFSGGGFSNVFARPSYQESAVASYLKANKPTYTSAQYNTSASRGFPDVSANGANYLTTVNGGNFLVYGTSASAPVFASIITQINDERIAVGKKPVGFINPTIYSTKFAKLFNDITSGGNQGCGTPGFTSVKGWDPVTGLGTPNTMKLLDAWMSLA